MTQQADNQNIGSGQFNPYDGNSEFQAIAFIVRQMVAELETMKLVQVKAVNPGSGSPPIVGTVDVQLLVQLIDGSGNASDAGVVYGIPYFRMQGGPWAIVCDPAVGDYGYVICSDRDITTVTSNIVGGQSAAGPPGSDRKYRVSDAIYVGGVLNQTQEAYIWLKSDGTFVLHDQSGNVVQTGSSGIDITPAGSNPVTVHGNLNVIGTIIGGFGGADQIGLQTHTHISGSAGNPTLPPTAGT